MDYRKLLILLKIYIIEILSFMKLLMKQFLAYNNFNKV